MIMINMKNGTKEGSDLKISIKISIIVIIIITTVEIFGAYASISYCVLFIIKLFVERRLPGHQESFGE